MDAFARCFLLVFAQLYVGGFLALSVPPFHEIGRGFYKSTAAVYLGIGLLVLAGRLVLLLRLGGDAGAADAVQLVELTFWVISLGAGCVYLRSLWGDAFRMRACAYALTWMSGVAALTAAAQFFRLSAPLSVETFLYPTSFVVSALVLGSVTTGMLLGHWYLIDRDLSLDPFRSVFRLFVTVLGIQAVLLLFDTGVLWIAGAGPSLAGLTRLFTDHSSLLTARVLISPIGTAALAWMIWKTLQIPQTMAATGLFYIAILSTLVGELMGRFILFRTSLPL